MFLGVGMMSLFAPLAMERVVLINPGQQLEAGSRTLHALRPPAFDNPSTLGFFESKSRALFISDGLGALLDAVPQNAAELGEDELRQGQTRWATIDTPWLHKVHRAIQAEELDRLRRTEPALILSSHLSAASGTMMERMLSTAGDTPQADPFLGPDQVALMAMMVGG